MPEKDFLLSPDQAGRLMALAEMIRHGELSFRGDDGEDEGAAKSLIIDIGQEIALQVGCA